jgi:hypothetical protein
MPHTIGIGGVVPCSVDQPLDDGGAFARRSVPAAVGFVLDEVQCQPFVGVSVAVAANESVALAQLLRVEEVNVPRLEFRLVERGLDDPQP